MIELQNQHHTIAHQLFRFERKMEVLLYCDYQYLNLKTQFNCNPLPRIQDVIDNVEGKNYFSVLV